MHSSEARREQQRARWSVLGTVILGVSMISLYSQGPREVLLVCGLGFMVGYIVERLQLSRTIVRLHLERGQSTPQAGA